MKAQGRKVWDVPKIHAWITEAVFKKNDNNKNCENWKSTCGKSGDQSRPKFHIDSTKFGSDQ